MKQLLFFILFLTVSYCSAQDTKLGCLLLDFENAPELNLTEGSILSDQYEAEFGLRFSLETGGFPVLAQVGSPGTAFVYQANGFDTPAPVDSDFIGSYFLTDDGNIGGLISPPMILDFSIPIDSFAGCILDMDFGEVFKIEAFDEFGVSILSDSIQAGDSGTGDGLATCWGFNLEGCVGTVYRVKFSGYRTQGGGFGLGLDNFSFCYSGINVDVEITQPTCLALDGSLRIFSTTSESYEYSLDGINYGADGEFFGLSPNEYEVFVRDENGCETSVIVPIVEAEDPLFVEVDVTNTTCDEDNGTVSFEVTPDINASFSLDGSPLTSERFFENLSPGEYTIQAVDDNGCTGSLNFEILPSTLPDLNIDSIIQESCIGNDGSVIASANSGTAPYQYQLNENLPQDSETFNQLSGGSYELAVIDSDGCTVVESFSIEPYPFILLTNVLTEDPECLLENGEILINVTGGFGQLSYTIDSINYQNDPLFENLIPGDYTIIIRDENDCSIESVVSLPIPLCPIYIPNIISANNDGVNDEFIIYVDPDYDVDILRYWIFDRWGERIFYSENFGIREFRSGSQVDKIWWDGKFKEEKAVEGVYAYLIEVRHENGYTEFLSGDVTLVR